MSRFPAGYPYPPLPIDFSGFDNVAHISEEICSRESYMDTRTIYPCDPSTGRPWPPFNDWAAWEMQQLSARREALLKKWRLTHCEGCEKEMPATAKALGDEICVDCYALFAAHEPGVPMPGHAADVKHTLHKKHYAQRY